jgi:O-antigen/teichoic acid export membrane protein
LDRSSTRKSKSDRGDSSKRRRSSRNSSQAEYDASEMRGEDGSEERPRRSRSRKDKNQKEHKQSAFTRMISHYWSRLLGAAAEGSLAGQEEEYGSHKTSRDYVWNTVGQACWAMLFPILTIVITQISGTEVAGMFSLAFVTGSLLMILGNYGVRTYQVSDIDEQHTFTDYLINRIVTCALMVLVGLFYCSIRGYTGEMLTISIGVYLYKMVDALSDVYEGRLQQVDKMYLGGISIGVRSLFALIVFTIVLLISKDAGIASIGMAIASFAVFLVLTLPLTLLESPKSRDWSFGSIGKLFKQCFPLFIALFMYAFIDAMPKFVMEGVLSYDNQLYFNAIYFPAQLILIVGQLVYKPLLVKLANVWADPSMHKKFDKVIIAMMGIIIAITAVVMILMGWIGIPIMTFLYGVDFEQFRSLMYVMMAAGGVTAAIDFLYQVITVLRRQRDVMKLYLITFGFSLFVPTLLINFTGLPGAVIGYLILMSILLVLLVSEYIAIRAQFNRTPNAAEQYMASAGISGAAPAGGAHVQGQANASAQPLQQRPVNAGMVVDFDPQHQAEQAEFNKAVAEGTLDEEQLNRAGYVKIPKIEQNGSDSEDSDFPDTGVDLDEP